jgi:tRNA/tmRNA/rRNA uracil-C5-methylase (TrmA/RlmC/RlmD family)
MANDEEPLRFGVNDVWYEVVDSDWLRNIEAGALKAVNGGLLSPIRRETDHSGVKAQEHPEQAAELQRLVDAMRRWIEEERQNGRPEYELQRLTVRDFFAHLRSRRPKQSDGE